MSSKKTKYLNMHDWIGTDPWRRSEISENFQKLDDKALKLDDSMAAATATAGQAKATAEGIDAKAESALTNSTSAVTSANTAVQTASAAVTKATAAKTTAEDALTKAQSADATAASVQNQFDQVVINGDSSIEAAQARVDTSGQTYTTLKQRLDSEHQSTTSLLAETLKQRFYFLDAFKNFFGGQTNDFVTGQATVETSATANALTGASVLSLASVLGLSAGVVLVVNGATPNQQLVSVTSVSGNDVNIAPALKAPVNSGAKVTPLWVNSSHLTPAGYDAWAYFIANAKDSNGNDILKADTAKVTLLGDSWIDNDSALFDAVKTKLPNATVVDVGVSGNTSAALLARFDNDVPADSDYVIFNEPGVNDVYQKYSLSTVMENLELLVKKIREINAIPIFTGFVPLSEHSDTTKILSEQVAALIDDGKNFPAVPSSNLALAIRPEVNSFAVGDNNLKQITTGTKNTAFGVDALRDITSGVSNVGLGYAAGVKITTGSKNLAIGDQSLGNNLSSVDNIAIGQATLFLTTGGSNVAIGSNAGFSVSAGNSNTMIGKGAGYQSGGSSDVDATTTGSLNVFIGFQAGGAPIIGNATAIGALAKASNYNAIAIGRSVVSSHQGAVVIGRDASDVSATSTANNDFVLGTDKHNVKVKGTLNVARKTPVGSADSMGAVGDITSDDNYIYAKTSTGWKRSALSVF